MPSAADVDAIVAMTMTTMPTMATATTQRDRGRGRCRIVSVDGPAGSGKTTLGDALRDAFADLGRTVAVLHMDDFYAGWEGLQADLEPRLIAQVFEPLADDRPARWQRYDWHASQFDGWVDLDPPQVLVLEGCGSGARAYDPYRCVLVWMEADRETRIARGIERDGDQVLPRWLAWMEREEAHFRLNATRERADIRLQTG